MDPNETLESIRYNLRMMDEMQSYQVRDTFATIAANAMRDLDEWLSKGGFLPDDWRTVEP